MSRPRLGLRCYCCGEPITDRMALVQAGPSADGADRVMIFRQQCLRRVDVRDAAVFVCITAAQPED